MRLVVFSHKPCWQSEVSPSGYATDGGFPFQMRALSELFDTTTVVVPCSSADATPGLMALTGHNLAIAPLTVPLGKGLRRKMYMPLWVLRNFLTLIRELAKSDVVHTPVPGDIGTIGMVLAFVFRKKLFVRYCGNWFTSKTTATRFLKWFMVRFAGDRNVMLTAGGGPDPPSLRSPNIRWIFSTSLTEEQLYTIKKERGPLSQNACRLIIVGRQERRKGTDVMIESLPLILNDMPHASLDVVGDGSALPEFRRMAAALGVRDRICFHGNVAHNEVIDLLHQADLFCFPTSGEGFPKVVLEALACGLPVVTSRVSVLPTLINTGCGMLVDEITPEAIAKAVKDCLSKPDRYRSMSIQATETAGQYSLERWRDEIGERLQAAWGPLRNGTG